MARRDRSPPPGRLDLRDVTLCAADSANVALSARALRLSMAACDFADAILFSHAPAAGPFRTVEIERLDSTAAYSSFVVKQLPGLIDTPYLLIVQWDGYVVDPTAWDPVFRQYDYIGARWPRAWGKLTVGNGGFSLRSRKFMKALAEPRFVLDERENGDWLVCRTFRPALERDFGVRFATERVADGFSYEMIEPSRPSFGFHGLGNMWRHVDDGEMLEIIGQLPPYVLHSTQCARLLAAYFVRKRLGPLTALYGRMKTRMEIDRLRILIAESTGKRRLARNCIGFCEALPM